MMIKRLQIFCGFCLIFLVACFSASAYGAMPAEQTLRYKVDVRGNNAGEIEVIIAKDGDGYLVKSISHLSALAKVFLKSYTVESNFAVIDGKLVLTGGREILNESGKVTRSFSVDNKTHTVSFSNENVLAFSPEKKIEADSFPLLLISNDIASLAGQRYFSVSPKRAREYQYHAPVKEKLTIGIGEFDSFLVSADRLDDPERFLKIWLRDSEQPVPLKIISGKPGRKTVLELIN